MVKSGVAYGYLEDSKMQLGKFFFLLQVLVFLAGASPTIAADAVAMVTDLQGKVTLRDDVRKPELAILSEIKSNTHVQLHGNAHLVLVYLQSGQEFEVKGPAVIAFGSEQPEGVSGNKPVRRGVALAKSGKGIRINPVVVTQAAIVMRSVNPGMKIKLLGPSGKTLEARPTFEWQVPQTDLNYQFELLDDGGTPLLSTSTLDSKQLLPDSVSLQEGMTYTWVVSTKLPDGKQSSNAADFSIASETLRDEVRALQPETNAPLSERVVYATWLEQTGLRDEARKFWKLIAAERQHDQRLKVLAGE